MFNFVARMFAPKVAGAAAVGVNPVFITDTYQSENGKWIFSFREEKTFNGGMLEFATKDDAILFRYNWVLQRKNNQMATFVFNGLPYDQDLSDLSYWTCNKRDSECGVVRNY